MAVGTCRSRGQDELKDVSKSLGDHLLIDKLSFTIPPGAIVGIIGPNGAGKSTLFKLITAKEKPDSGEVVVGSTVRMAVVDQTRDDLTDKKTVFDDVSAGADIITVGKFEMSSRAYLGRFNFKGGDVLLLDEPSNDLDVETLHALEDALLEFPGCVMLISHDRWLLDRIATPILAAQRDPQWTFFEGNYQGYEADKRQGPGEEGAKPKRIRFKALK